MSSDRTDAVIEAIDGALDDWSVSGDAMRWTPEPAVVNEQPRAVFSAVVEHAPGCSIVHEYLTRPPSCQCGALDRARRALGTSRLAIAPLGTDPRVAGEWTDISHLVDTFVMNPWQGAVLSRVFGSTFREAAEALARSCAASAGEIERLLSTVAELRPVITDESAAEDPRARALRLRQQRSTGPERAPASRQKRPRRLR